MALITPTQDNISPWSSLQNDHCNYVLLIDVTTRIDCVSRFYVVLIEMCTIVMVLIQKWWREILSVPIYIYIYIGTLIVHKTNHFIFHVMIHANCFLIWTESTFFISMIWKQMSDFSIWYILYCERGHNRHIYWSPPQMEITYERHDGLWQSDWSRYTRINNSKKNNQTNPPPSISIEGVPK
jgi:hypothetical protein